MTEVMEYWQFSKHCNYTIYQGLHHTRTHCINFFGESQTLLNSRTDGEDCLHGFLNRHAEAVEVDAEAEVEPAVSDAGTYTIDDEEEKYGQ